MVWERCGLAGVDWHFHQVLRNPRLTSEENFIVGTDGVLVESLHGDLRKKNQKIGYEAAPIPCRITKPHGDKVRYGQKYLQIFICQRWTIAIISSHWNSKYPHTTAPHSAISTESENLLGYNVPIVTYVL